MPGERPTKKSSGYVQNRIFNGIPSSIFIEWRERARTRERETEWEQEQEQEKRSDCETGKENEEKTSHK